MEFSRPKLVVSKCIEFDHCRYDGHQMSSPLVHLLKDHVDFIPVCPEVEIGLGIPREAVRVVKRGESFYLQKSMSGDDHTEEMLRFGSEFLNKIPTVHGFILKSRSPSCGIKDVKVYPGIGKLTAIPEKKAGFFGEMVLEQFPGIPIEDEGRLTNLRIREHFLTVIFLLAEFDSLPEKMGALVDFHSRHKYLFMACNQKELTVAGKIVANHEHKSREEVFLNYKTQLFRIIEKIPRYSALINVIQHLFGYFSKYLNPQEKADFFTELELYRRHQIPVIAIVSILRSWIERFDLEYLRKQSFFNPFPRMLITSINTS
ncbi:MAG: DUF523 and DUF1722 domain-containing protein, partial [Candidatus Cloacimonetes bacterium]|nr:DUF523 and DUF1722 domain-containing protein [Candidatus Cloacimonadota bacterium]